MGVTKKKKAVAKKAKAEDAKICHLCGELIVGDYDYVGQGAERRCISAKA